MLDHENFLDTANGALTKVIGPGVGERIAFVPDGGRMFEPEVTRADAGGVDIKFHRCPLKEAWLEAGDGPLGAPRTNPPEDLRGVHRLAEG